jgi:restriction system protein
LLDKREIDMPVPTYDQFIEPILRFLARHPEGAVAREVHDGAAAALNLSESDRQELLPSGSQQVYKNRAGWAHDRLKRAGLSSSPRRGFWRLTQDGLAFAAQRTEPFSAELLWELATGHKDVRLRDAQSPTESSDVPTIEASAQLVTASPDDQLVRKSVESS